MHFPFRAAPMNANLAKATAVGALGRIVVWVRHRRYFRHHASLDNYVWIVSQALGVTVAMALVGTVIGAMTAGFPGQKWGGRETLRVLAVFYVMSALGCAFAWNWDALLVARFIGGLGIGGSSVLGPVYIAGIGARENRGTARRYFPDQHRDRHSARLFFQLSHRAHGTWRCRMALAAGHRSSSGGAFSGFALWHSAELALAGYAEARGRGARRPANDGRGRSRRRAARNRRFDSPRAVAELPSRFFPGNTACPLFLAITIGMFNQLSGINAILYYLNDIFAAAGFSKMSGDLQAVAVGGMNLAATLLGMSVIDKLGRKTLLLIGSVGTAACLFGVSWVFFTNSHQSYLLIFLVAYIAFFAISQGAVIWVYISEVFPNRVRAKGQSVGSSSHWIMNAIIAYTFPQLAKSSGRVSLCVFRGDDGAAILCCAELLPRDQRILPRRDATPLGYRVIRSRKR